MNLSIHLDKVRGNSLLRELIERKIEKIIKFLEDFQSDMVDLTIILNQNTKKRLFQSKIVLKLPAATLISDKSGYSSFEAISRSFKSLIIEIKKHKELLKHKSSFGKNAIASQRIEEINNILSGKIFKENEKQNFLKIIEKNINSYIFFAREEMNIIEAEYQRKINFIIPEEIVDTVILELLENPINKNMGDLQFETEIYEKIKNSIRELIEIRLTSDETISLESGYLEPSISEDEIYDYYQPDTFWHIEDVFKYPLEENEIDFESKIIEQDEILSELRVYMKTINPKDRQIFYLYFIQRHTASEISELVSLANNEVTDIINQIQNDLTMSGIELNL